MITAAELSRSVYGAWLLARFDARGVMFFENTTEAFWRSFWAAGVVLPGYGVLLALRSVGTNIGVSAPTAFIVHCFTYVMVWIAFPFAMFYLARLFDREQWYCRYIAAYNWSVVLQVALVLAVSLVAASGLIPLTAGGVLIRICQLAIMIYQGFIAHVALQATLPGAVGIVLLDFVLSRIIYSWSDALLKLETVSE